MFPSFSSDRLAEMRRAERLAEAEQSRLVKLARQVAREEKTRNRQRTAQPGSWVWIRRNARLVRAGVATWLMTFL